MKYSIIIILFLGLLFTGGHVFSENDKEKIAREINVMTIDLSCDHDIQCRSFGFGHKPCGGYWEYRLYSTKTIDETMLLRKTERYKTLDKIYNNVDGGGSICDVTQPIHAACIQRKCVSMGDELNYVTPVHYATEQNDITLIEDLIATGHDINSLSVRNETPLLYAVQINAVTSETVEFLIKKGANVNFKSAEKSNTPLIHAVTQERLTIVKTLLENGANPHLSNHWGSALDYARKIDNKEILKMILAD